MDACQETNLGAVIGLHGYSARRAWVENDKQNYGQ